MSTSESITAKRAADILRCISSEDREVLDAYIKDRERAAARANPLEAGAISFLLSAGAVTALCGSGLVLLWLLGAFEPDPPFTEADCPTCPACAVPEQPSWFGVGRTSDRMSYTYTDTTRCVAIEDFALCTSTARAPSLPPETTP